MTGRNGKQQRPRAGVVHELREVRRLAARPRTEVDNDVARPRREHVRGDRARRVLRKPRPPGRHGGAPETPRPSIGTRGATTTTRTTPTRERSGACGRAAHRAVAAGRRGGDEEPRPSLGDAMRQRRGGVASRRRLAPRRSIGDIPLFDRRLFDRLKRSIDSSARSKALRPPSLALLRSVRAPLARARAAGVSRRPADAPWRMEATRDGLGDSHDRENQTPWHENRSGKEGRHRRRTRVVVACAYLRIERR